MANADTEADDWFFYAKKFHKTSGKPIGTLSVLIASGSLRLVHEFHCVGAVSGAMVPDDAFYDFYMSGGQAAFVKFSLRGLRGLPGWVWMTNGDDFRFGAQRSGKALFTSVKDYTDGTTYVIKGQWMLKQTLAYADVFGS